VELASTELCTAVMRWCKAEEVHSVTNSEEEGNSNGTTQREQYTQCKVRNLFSIFHSEDASLSTDLCYNIIIKCPLPSS
jgi:hypothetical protein